MKHIMKYYRNSPEKFRFLSFLYLLSLLSTSIATETARSYARPTIEYCASQFTTSEAVAEITITSKGPWIAPQLAVKLLPNQVANDPRNMGEQNCWEKVLGMPNPNSKSVSFGFNFRVSSQAPGLDASIRDAVLEAPRSEQALTYRKFSESLRPELAECTSSYLMRDQSLQVNLEFSPSSHINKLKNWSVSMPDPVKIDDRELFQMFARCLTGALGTDRFLQQVEFANGDIFARSQQ